MAPFWYPTTPQIWKSRHEWLSHTQMYVRSKQHEKSPYNWIISQQFAMLWRSLWKSHVATVSRTKASLCKTSVSQNHPHPSSKRNHCCYCVGLTNGQQKETEQKRKRSQAATRLHALTVEVLAAYVCLTAPRATWRFGTKLLLSSTMFQVCYDGTYKASVKSERVIGQNREKPSKNQHKAVNVSSKM